MPDDAALGQQLKRLREAVGMSQADLAEGMQNHGFAGIYPQTIVKLEQGRRALKFEEGLAIAALFRVEAEALGAPGSLISEADVTVRTEARAVEQASEETFERFGELVRAHGRLVASLEGNEDQVSDTLRSWLDQVIDGSSPAATVRQLQAIVNAKGWG